MKRKFLDSAKMPGSDDSGNPFAKKKASAGPSSDKPKKGVNPFAESSDESDDEDDETDDMPEMDADEGSEDEEAGESDEQEQAELDNISDDDLLAELKKRGLSAAPAKKKKASMNDDLDLGDDEDE